MSEDDPGIGQSTVLGGGITLRRLQIFSVVAYSETLTKAAKLLGVAQPSLSQQISGLESAVGTKLFERRSNRMALTEDGRNILRLAERVLNSMQALEDGARAIGEDVRQTIRLAGLSSIMRTLLPRALGTIPDLMTEVDFDIHESAPAEMMDLLYGRHINLGLIALDSVDLPDTGFHQEPIMIDPLVLAVPRQLQLEKVSDPEIDLTATDLALLNRTIQFVFATQYGDKVQAWYDRALPRNRLFARVRSYESAVAMVQQDLGICIVPALSTLFGGKAFDKMRLYRVDLEPRRIVALLPPQYRHNSAYTMLIKSLQSAGASFEMPVIHDLPPFMSTAL